MLHLNLIGIFTALGGDKLKISEVILKNPLNETKQTLFKFK